MHKTAIVVGAGIAGLATARALAMRGYRVKIIERTSRAVGASIRNFGMIWPVGQPEGELYEQAMLSRNIWKQVCDAASVWYDETGSLHLAYQPDERIVLEELAERFSQRGYQLLSPGEALERSAAIVKEGLRGGLYSAAEMIVDPRIALPKIASWLKETCHVEFIWDRAVTAIRYPDVSVGHQTFSADQIFICNGSDFETLYPELFSAQPLVKCKLQMMRMGPQPGGFRMGPSLCGGLSLIHYASFKAASSLPQLKKRYEQDLPGYIQWGIHVMVSQNQQGELTIGDSHEYSVTHDPFDRQEINQLILGYLRTFARFENEQIVETWNGLYPKLTNGESHLVLHPEQGVMVINGLGGAGMTLSFGLCERLIGRDS